jgi:hypothetical protein
MALQLGDKPIRSCDRRQGATSVVPQVVYFERDGFSPCSDSSILRGLEPFFTKLFSRADKALKTRGLHRLGKHSLRSAFMALFERARF